MILEDIHRILQRDDKGISDATNAAAKLLRSIFADLNIGPRKWDRLHREYLNNPHNGVTPSKRSSYRSNLNRALSKNSYTWKVFRKSIQVLNPISVTYTLDLTWQPGVQMPKATPTQLSFTPQSHDNELHYLFQTLLNSTGITPRVWGGLVERWLNSLGRIGNNPPDRSTERGNIRKALFEKRSYTWNTFCKGLAIMKIQEAVLTVQLEWRTKTTLHQYRFNPRSEIHVKSQ